MVPEAALGRRLPPTGRTTLRRKRERGSADWALVLSVLDEGLVCHVGFSDQETTYVIPMTYARVADVLYLHGASANRTLRTIGTGAEACVTVTLLDGLVMARSAFHHSMNYRSVMLFGTPARVTDPSEQQVAAAALLDHLAPGRSGDARPPSPSELRATLLLRMAITEGSAKVRTGGPVDEDEDLSLEVWAGVIPIAMAAGAPVGEPDLPAGVTVPAYATGYRRGRGGPGSADGFAGKDR